MQQIILVVLMSFVMSLCTTALVLAGDNSPAAEKYTFAVDTVSPDAIKQLETDLFDCLKAKAPDKYIYLIEICQNSSLYTLLISEDLVITRRRALNVIGARSYSDNPPREDEYPIIIFTDSNRNGMEIERKILPGFAEDSSRFLFRSDTFSGTLSVITESYCPEKEKTQP